MAARLEGRYKTRQEQLSVKIREFRAAFALPEDAIGAFAGSRRLARQICFVVVRIRRFTSAQQNSSTTCQSAKRRLQSTKFITLYRVRAPGLAARVFLYALHSATCGATTAIPSTPFTRGLKETWAKFWTRSRRISALWSRLQAGNHCCRRTCCR